MRVALFLLAVLLPAAEHHLFVDDYYVASASGTRRVIHAVTKHPANPILLPAKPWEGQYALLYGTVIRDEEDGLWKMWYSTMNHFRYAADIFPESTYLCYATSHDGLTWDKPSLGLIPYRGHTENNIVFQAHEAPEQAIYGILDAVSILKDPRDADPARRYKMMIWHHNQKFAGGKKSYHLTGPMRMGHYVAFSPDGLRWREEPEPVFPYLPVRDTMATMWDARSRRFVAYVKQQVDGKRARFWSESEDFLHWSPPQAMLAADAQDPPDVELYANTGFPYADMYLGLMTVFHPSPKDNIYLDIQLISSRDGRKWERVGDRAPFIPVGRRDIDWDFGFNSPASNPPVRVGDELWFYYSGRAYRHPIDGQSREPNKGAIGLATLRLDGFVSMDAAEGTVTTKPVAVDGTSLYVNSTGEVTVEVLETGARAVLRGDSVRHRALSGLAAGKVRLRFSLRNASLYSFWFGS